MQHSLNLIPQLVYQNTVFVTVLQNRAKGILLSCAVDSSIRLVLPLVVVYYFACCTACVIHAACCVGKGGVGLGGNLLSVFVVPHSNFNATPSAAASFGASLCLF